MEIVLDAGADDLQTEEDFFIIQTTIESFEKVRKAIADQKLTVENASLQWIAKNLINVAGENAEKVIKLIESMEDCDDVQNVFTNADIDDSAIN